MPATAPASDLDFRFSFALPALVAGLPFGIGPSSARLTISADRLVARFGPWCLETDLANVAGAAITGPYSWPRVIGPARLSLRDRGLTFATTDRRGVCIRFREPVPAIDPFGVIRHPALTVTVADAPALVEVLEHAAQRAASGGAAPTQVDDVVIDVADDLRALTARELRERARSLGIRGVSSMKKDELVDALSPHIG